MKGHRRWDETWHRLLGWTNASGAAERLAGQILLDQGFTDLDPSHPLGGRDGGADALTVRDGTVWVSAVYFPRGQQPFPAIEEKFTDDLEGVAKNGADGFVFITNQELRRSERSQLGSAFSGPLLVLHLERLVAVLDQPRMQAVREQFLGIEAPAGLDRSERLSELERASIARCEARWLSVGLSGDEAADLALRPGVGAVSTSLLPREGQRLVIWTAPMGSGKSIGSERHHQTTIAAAAADEDAPLPVYLPAAQALPRLATALTSATTELGDARRSGVAAVVDGLDELGYQAASSLLLQARELARTWPSTTILLTSRPVPALTEAEEHLALPALTTAQQDECLDIGSARAGDEWRPNLHSFAEPVRATLGQPLFALLAGLWIRERGTTPHAPIELMRLLGERATRGVEVDEQTLRTLAIRSITRELGPVPEGDVLNGASPDPLLATGMVARRAGGLVYVLPAMAQWFAAQAILRGELTTADVIAVPEDIELWRYPLALTLALGSADEVQSALIPLLEGNAGFAMRVLDAAFGQSVLTGATPPPWREGGLRARQSLQALCDSLGPTARFVIGLRHDGRLLPMGVASNDIHLTVAFSRDESREDVFALPSGVSPFDPGEEWAGLRLSKVGPSAAWSWSWALRSIRHGVKRMLEHSALPVPLSGPLGQEAVWVTACDLLDKSILDCDALETERVIAAIDDLAVESFDIAQSSSTIAGVITTSVACERLPWRRRNEARRASVLLSHPQT